MDIKNPEKVAITTQLYVNKYIYTKMKNKKCHNVKYCFLLGLNASGPGATKLENLLKSETIFK